MKILYFNHNGDTYGPGRSLLRMSERLVAEGYEVCAVLPENGPLKDALEQMGVEVRLFPRLARMDRCHFKSIGSLSRFAGQILWSLVGLPRLIRSVKPDVVHTNLSVLFLTGFSSRLCGVPHVQHIREWEKRAGHGWKLYCGMLALFSDRVVANSTYVAQQFPPRLRRKVSVVYNGIRASEFDGVSRVEAESLRRAWGWENNVIVGTVGRINLERKGQGTVVEAAKIVVQACPGVRFLFVGGCVEGKEYFLEQLEKQIHESHLDGYIRILPATDNIALVNHALDVAVMPSLMPEGLGNTSIEAMAASKPVVGTAHGGTLDVIENGVTGFLYPPGDAEVLARHLIALATDPENRRTMGVAAHNRFMEKFEYAITFNKLAAIYQELVNNAGRMG